MSISTQIVIEIGSAYIRAGFGGEASPRCIVRCAVNFTDTASDRSALDLQLHELFHEIFVERLHIKPKICSVLVIEKLLETKLLRDSVFTLLFKVFQVNALINTKSCCTTHDNTRYDRCMHAGTSCFHSTRSVYGSDTEWSIHRSGAECG